MKLHHTSFSSLFLIIAIAALLVDQSTASCGVCGTNGIACISETDFYICSNGTPNTSKVQTCPNNGTCTALLGKCFEATNAPADCTTVTCGCTVDSGTFACTSRTTFAQCNGNETVATGTCPTGLICSTKGGEICKDACILEGVIECDKDASTS
ncbi:uncharacterized protein LOC129242892 [Anastrepha obliqua]|uniref:uncharacterized protein LOC129242892 n=1 Tax=Anastrepha obliqua TaxID=95512 RepID=UPI002409D630|nr:uncharacterized protein LOC129242892 [Anastrepha obliqua]